MKRGVGAALTTALLIGIVAAATAGTMTTRYWWKGGHTKADIAKIDAALKGVSGVTKVEINKRGFAITCEGTPATVASLNEALSKAGTYSIGGEVTGAHARTHAQRAARAPATPATPSTTK